MVIVDNKVEIPVVNFTDEWQKPRKFISNENLIKYYFTINQTFKLETTLFGFTNILG